MIPEEDRESEQTLPEAFIVTRPIAVDQKHLERVYLLVAKPAEGVVLQVPRSVLASKQFDQLNRRVFADGGIEGEGNPMLRESIHYPGCFFAPLIAAPRSARVFVALAQTGEHFDELLTLLRGAAPVTGGLVRTPESN